MTEKLTEKDVGMIEDMIFVLKNLISAEDHCAMSYGMNKDKKWIEALDIIRRIRTKWLDSVVKKENSALWCFSKHILASAEGLIEVGNRFNQTKQTKEAQEAYSDANELISLFQVLNDYEDGETKSSA